MANSSSAPFNAPGVYITEINNVLLDQNDPLTVLTAIILDLNKYLKSAFSVTEDKAILSRVFNADGTTMPGTENKIVVQLINLEQNYNLPKQPEANSKWLFSLHLLFSATGINYEESLRMISVTAGYIKMNFSKASTNPAGSFTDIEIVQPQLSYQELAGIHSMTGTGSMPSLVYKLNLGHSLDNFLSTLPFETDSKNARKHADRRLLDMIEAAVKLLLNSFVFSPNTLTTWTMIKYRCASYLYILWEKGMLKGSTPQEAYDVAIGLGITMTPEDILNGYMLLSVRIALKGGSELTELTFRQMMIGGA